MPNENEKQNVFRSAKTTRNKIDKNEIAQFQNQILSSIHQNKNDIAPGSYLECFPQPRMRLNKLEEFVIGRDSSCHLVIDAEDVSRKHAIIEWDIEKSSYIIADLDSINGMFVNGKVCKKHMLKDKDIVQIGEHNICFYQIGLIEPTQKYPGLSRKVTTVRRTRESTIDPLDNLFKGDLRVVDLSTVIQMIASKKKTGYLEIQEQEICAYIYFEKGLVVHSEVANIKGEEAFFIIMGCVNGKFIFVPDERPEKTTMEDEAEYLLLQLAQREDEARRDS